ncbi:MAG TPA: bifunctional glutamate N-acetyltransferase/amino-acid acetyltransferase ArgJ [Chloroflexota bacterium]|nr:bifunctional glutamate N-acetyltransferase/amino-acid acetyltransferase ArgJ [Chloroflexota bacterium]
MNVMRDIPGGLLAPKGWSAAATRANIKGSGGDKLDLGLLVSDTGCAAAGVFTQNQLRAAPVRWCQRLLPAADVRAVVANSGNANACTGEQGFRDASDMASLTASALAVEPRQVLVASTGVIGVPLPMDRLREGMKALRLGSDGDAFNDAIMTTDTRRKQASVAVEIGGREVRFGGVAKGAGMIHPHMATMLCFITSDAAVDVEVLPNVVMHAADLSFNMLTVDGDTSTNDMLVVLCNGIAGNPPVRAGTPEAELLGQAIESVALSLGRQLAADGEGASKSLDVRVTGAYSDADARQAARAVAASNLVKCAVYGNDPNWGRVFMALGNTSVRLEESRIGLSINGMRLVAGGVATAFDARAASQAMKASLVTIDLDLGLGSGQATAFGCDMTPDYVTFNADYTT